MKRTLQCFFLLALALLFAGMLPAAETSLSNGTLTIDFNEDDQWVEVSNNGMMLIVESNETITGAGSSFQVGSVNRIVVTDSGNHEGQSLTFEPGSEITLSGGLSVSGVEQVYFLNAVTSTGSSGIEVIARQNIFVADNLTGGDGGINLTGEGVEDYGEFGVLVLVLGAKIIADGSISITGIGESGGKGKNGVEYQRGVSLLNTEVETTGSASITITGKGGDGNYEQIEGIAIYSSTITSEDGNIVIHGTGGNFGSFSWASGVTNWESTIETTGSGDISITGIGGNFGSDAWAPGVTNWESTIKTTGSGYISITGKGGTGERVYGIFIGGEIVSVNGNIRLEGEGGTGSHTTSGIWVVGEIVSTNGNIVMIGKGGIFEIPGPAKFDPDFLFGGINLYEAHIEAKGTASISMTGTGGEGPSNYLTGVGITSSLITAENGNIVITGTGGEPDDGFSDDSGVRNVESTIKTTGSGNIEIIGTAGSGKDENYGISIGGELLGGFKSRGGEISALMATGSGDITLTGTPGENAATTSGVKFGLYGEMLIEQKGTGQVEIIADQILIHESNAQITAENNTVILRPLTEDWPIDLGGADSKSHHLLLTNKELNRITAGKLIIGHSDAGTISISDDITLESSTNTELHSGGDIIFEHGGFNTGGGTMLLSPGTSPKAVRPVFDGTDVSASTLSFASNLAILINGTTPGDGTNTYTQLTVDGYIDLRGVELDVSGSHNPAPGESFTIVKALNNFNITGTFNGLSEGGLIDNFLGSGRGAFITYVGGAGNDVVIWTCTPPTSGGTIEATQTICYGTAHETFTSVTVPEGHTGDLEYQWQMSAVSSTASFQDWDNVGSVTTTASYEHLGTVTQTTWFRRLARVTCDPVGWASATASNVVQVSVDPLPTASAGGRVVICENQAHQVSGASAAHYSTFFWEHNGAGELTNETTLSPTYTSHVNDVGNTVILTLTVTGTGTCGTATATANYTIHVGGYTYYRWVISEIRNINDMEAVGVQAAEFQFAIDGVVHTWSDVTISGVGNPAYGETVDKLIDGDLSSKWMNLDITTGQSPPYNYSGSDAIVTFEFDAPKLFDGYRWATAAGYLHPDSENARDPKAWVIQASIDATNWVTLHSVSDFEATGWPVWQGPGNGTNFWPLNAESSAAIIPAEQVVCIGSVPDDLTVVDNLGDVIKWQKSDNPEFENAADIGTITSTILTGTDIGTLTKTTWFRAVLKSTMCGEILTASATITVKTLSIAPTAAQANPALINPGDISTLSYSGGTPGTGAEAIWYTGSCGGVEAGRGTTLTVSPTTTTTYWVRFVGDCNTTDCASVSVWISGEAMAFNLEQSAYFDQIQPAINDADAGNTIQIKAGTFTETVDTNNKGLTLQPGFTGDAGSEVIIKGNFNLTADDKLQMELFGDNDYDRFTIQGNAFINGAKLKIMVKDGYKPETGTRFTILSSDNDPGKFTYPTLIKINGNFFILSYEEENETWNVVLTAVAKLFKLQFDSAGQR